MRRMMNMRAADRKRLEKLFRQQGFGDFKWIAPERVVVAEWVRMKCIFGCWLYGKNATCPPNTPAVDECRRFFGAYREGAVFHFEKSVSRPTPEGFAMDVFSTVRQFGYRIEVLTDYVQSMNRYAFLLIE